MTPDISVLMPCYNCVHTLKRAVRSALMQAGVSVEVILVDDCSTDSTRGLIAELADTYTNVRAVYRKENGRIAAALNDAGKVAKGAYFMRLDSDDWLDLGCLAKLKAALDSNPRTTFAYGARQYYGRRTDKYTPAPYQRVQFDLHNAAGYSYLFRRNVWDSGIRWEALGTFGGAVIDLEDWQHIHKMLQAGFEGVSLPNVLVMHYLFRWDGTWQELKDNQPAALAEFKRRYPSVKAMNL